MGGTGPGSKLKAVICFAGLLVASSPALVVNDIIRLLGGILIL